MVTLLKLDFSYHALSKRTYDATSTPEIQLMSLVVIATKLAHPFDDVDRTPESYSDPSAVKINWSQWVKSASRESQKGLARGEAIKVTDADVWNMNAGKLDDYLDWYQKTWIDDRDPKSKL